MNEIVKGAAVAALAALATVACTTAGYGVGSSRGNDVTATFAWSASNDRTGSLAAALSTGEKFSGQFFQITAESRIDDLSPLWGGWHSSWHGWGYWDRSPSSAFVTHYSGKVVANLQGPGNEHMRCHFQLIRPSSGMSGGGEGQCQLPSGKTIDATFTGS